MALRQFDREALIADASFLADDGVPFDEAARRLRIKVKTLDRILRNEGKRDIRDKLSSNSLKRGITITGEIMSSDDVVRNYIKKGIHPDEFGTCTISDRPSPLRPAHVLRFPGRKQVREGQAEWTHGALGLLPPGDVR